MNLDSSSEPLGVPGGDRGCWVVYTQDWHQIFEAVFPANQEAEARRFAMANHHDCMFVEWGEPVEVSDE